MRDLITISMKTKPPMRLQDMGRPELQRVQKPVRVTPAVQSTGKGRTVVPPVHEQSRTAAQTSAPPVRGQTWTAVQTLVPPVHEQSWTAVQTSASPVREQSRMPARTQAPLQRTGGSLSAQASLPPGRPGEILPGVQPGQLLQKGQKASLVQTGPAPEEIRVCMGWQVKDARCDLDVSAFLLGADGRVIGDEWFVFYGQCVSPDRSVSYYRDGQKGRAGDAAAVSIDLKRVNPQVKKIVFVVTINEALTQRLNFSMVSDAYVRVVEGRENRELLRFVLSDYYANVASMMVGELYERNGQWKFNAVGNGVARDLAGLCELYGVQVTDS